MRRLFLLLLTFGINPISAFASEERTLQNSPLEANVIAQLLILFGCIFILAAALGLIRFPDFYTRLHATTKLVALGGLGIFGGAALAFAPLGAMPRVLIIAAFFFLTAPLSAYMIARSGYLRGLRPYQEEQSVDDWGLVGEFPDQQTGDGQERR